MEEAKKTEYDSSCNYCSPKGLPKVISKLIPDVIFGVNIGYSCYQHTLGWTEAKQTRDHKVHDLKFKKNIQEAFMGAPHLTISVNKWKIKLPESARKPIAKAVSNAFYASARIGRGIAVVRKFLKKIKEWNKKP